MLIDTHAHLDFPEFDNDRDSVIKRSQEEGIDFIINVASSFNGCLASLDLAQRYSFVYASVGIHPHNAAETNDDRLKQIESFVNREKVVAIGEVGLDFYRNLSPQDIQKEFFLKFINLSISTGLPLIIHSREAREETLKILRQNKLKGVVHCFSGDEDFLKRCLDLGLYISFTCNITYKKSESLRELAKLVPLDRLLLETDSPYLSPQPLRGSRNEPVNVKFLAQELADLRNCSIDEIASNTTSNAKRLFKLERK